MRLTRPYRDRDAGTIIRDLADAIEIIAERLPAARASLKGWQTTLRSTEGAGRSHGGSPTESAAIASTAWTDKQGKLHKGTPVDDVGGWLLAIDQTLHDVREALYKLVAEAYKYTDNEPPKNLEPGCLLCASHADVWQAVYQHDIDARGERIGRCAWHDRFWNDYGVDAHQELTIWHIQNPNARRTSTTVLHMIKAHHPEAYAKHHYLQGTYRAAL